MDCVFCNIIIGKIPAEILYSNERVIALLDVNPIHPGHALVLPRRHVTDLLHLPDDTLHDMMLAIRTVSSGLVRALHLEGFNVFSNNGSIAGQSVFHFHVHITPRYQGDNIRFVHGNKHYREGEMEKFGKSIRASINEKHKPEEPAETP